MVTVRHVQEVSFSQKVGAKNAQKDITLTIAEKHPARDVLRANFRNG